MARREDEGMINSVYKNYDATKLELKKFILKNFLDFISERMFAYNRFDRKILERSLEDHIDITGLGCFFLSKAIDEFISKI